MGEGDTVHGFLFRDPAAQRDLVASTFAGDGWEVPRLVAAMRTADDLFFDVVSQIRMPRGRPAGSCSSATPPPRPRS
uniref:hypothetical protein n=1 Tax=Herbidospora sakaeratensis TaxID=564415 RepID=UPI000783BC88|nr:hypothetical protein [Herbidospora sakaeratensis]